ncbi:hypothetical protein ZWY2020_044287 [Hordeum vulgare]|nr:hypothetical protein ZWY2020_044287 [Hordeum vulgare]
MATTCQRTASPLSAPHPCLRRVQGAGHPPCRRSFHPGPAPPPSLVGLTGSTSLLSSPALPRSGVYKSEEGRAFATIEKKEYLACLKLTGARKKCRMFSKKYLECRMESFFDSSDDAARLPELAVVAPAPDHAAVARPDHAVVAPAPRPRRAPSPCLYRAPTRPVDAVAALCPVDRHRPCPDHAAVAPAPTTPPSPPSTPTPCLSLVRPAPPTLSSPLFI